MSPPNIFLCLRFLDHIVRIDCEDDAAAQLLRANFEGLLTTAAEPHIHYAVSGPGQGPFHVRRRESDFSVEAAQTGDLIYELEGDLVVALQLANPEHAFFHAAALVKNQAIHLLTGHSGAGKSTTSFGLTHYGFGLATDEMIAISLASNEVTAFRHAVCLKRYPPDGFELPDGTVESTRGFHMPPSALGGNVDLQGLKVSSIFFVEHDPDAPVPTLRTCENAEAMTRLYPNMLNALSHPGAGLEAAAVIARESTNYVVSTARLSESCELISKTVESL